VVSAGARLVIWLPVARDAQIVAPPGAQQTRLNGGVQVALTNVDPGRPVTFAVQQGRQSWRWHLPLTLAERHPDLQSAIQRLKAGDVDAASALVSRAWNHLDDRLRALGLAVRAEVAPARGQDDQWFALRTEAAAQALRAGALSSAAKHHLALAHGYLTRRHDLALARIHIERAVSLGLTGVTALQADMQRGYLAERSGALGTALERFSAADLRAERLDQKLDRWLARRKRAAILASIGRFDEALTQSRLLAKEARDKSPCGGHGRRGGGSGRPHHRAGRRGAGTLSRALQDRRWSAAQCVRQPRAGPAASGPDRFGP
jgi:hypothetical protein